MKDVKRKYLSILLFALVGCSTVENVSEVETVSRNAFAGHTRSDSVIMHDSVFIRERCDTVFYTKYRTIYKERFRVDTIMRCDTLYRYREIIVEKVRETRKRSSLLWKLPLVALFLFLLWRTGLWRVMWNFIKKGVLLCSRVFRSKV